MLISRMVRAAFISMILTLLFFLNIKSYRGIGFTRTYNFKRIENLVMEFNG